LLGGLLAYLTKACPFLLGVPQNHLEMFSASNHKVAIAYHRRLKVFAHFQNDRSKRVLLRQDIRHHHEWEFPYNRISKRAYVAPTVSVMRHRLIINLRSIS
jgi:hypothetical protein